MMPTFLIFNSDSAVSDTVIDGYHITSNTTWYLDDSPYYIEGDVHVDSGANLTIEAGVEVRFNGYYGLFIHGNLTAVGSPLSRITFTSNKSSPSTPDWNRIHINSTGYARIYYCDISYADYAVFLNWSSVNDIQSNIITDNVEGIHLYYSSDNAILNNNISDNIIRGLYLWYSDFNAIRYNRIFSNLGDGVTIFSSSDNEMNNNNVSLNGGYGIRLTSSENNRIFHNNLNDNANQAYDNDGNNDWDDGYPTGGNYWSDYTGEDVNQSAGQDVPGSDGIGDEPYTNIDGGAGAIDNFPLMNQTPDTAPVSINLISPRNNSVIKAGTIIDLDIKVPNIHNVSYSVNSSSNQTIDPPDYDINTTGWSDGDHLVDVWVIDTNGSVNSSWFFFVIDSTKPVIELNSPQNNSLIKAGGIINLTISEPHLRSVSYYLNAELQGGLLYPHDIDTLSWPDDVYTIEIHAEDNAGNNNSTWYIFTMDSTPPLISLNSPKNNSFIKPGIPINFSISDEHLNSVNYSFNGGPEQSFAIQYFINTTLFDDGGFSITVNAIDDPDNFDSRYYEFVIDTVSPLVILNSPSNNSLIRGGVPLNFSVVEANPFDFRYSLYFGNDEVLFSPYDINTSDWMDIQYFVKVNVTDYAGNSNITWYNITIDSSQPDITLLSPLNNSFIRAGTDIVFQISEPNLIFANYSINSGEPQDLATLSIIDTSGWPDGAYDIQVSAGDSVGNNISLLFTFNVDNSPPNVVSTTPRNGDERIPADTSIKIRFDELMDEISLMNAVSISPQINLTLNWDPDNLTLLVTPHSNLTNSTKYIVVINTSAEDMAGNAMEKDFVFSFTTQGAQKEDLLWLFILSILAIILGLILFAWLISTRKKGMSEEAEEEDEFDVEGKGTLDDEDVETSLLAEGGALREEGAGEAEDLIVTIGLEEGLTGNDIEELKGAIGLYQERKEQKELEEEFNLGEEDFEEEEPEGEEEPEEGEIGDGEKEEEGGEEMVDEDEEGEADEEVVDEALEDEAGEEEIEKEAAGGERAEEEVEDTKETEGWKEDDGTKEEEERGEEAKEETERNDSEDEIEGEEEIEGKEE